VAVSPTPGIRDPLSWIACFGIPLAEHMGALKGWSSPMSVRALWNLESTTIGADEGSHPELIWEEYEAATRHLSEVAPPQPLVDGLVKAPAARRQAGLLVAWAITQSGQMHIHVAPKHRGSTV
jgi:hypothetical protein